MTVDYDRIERALEKAEQMHDSLTDDERAQIREVLIWWRTWKAWGKLGKVILWAVISIGAVTAAAREAGVLEWLKR